MLARGVGAGAGMAVNAFIVTGIISIIIVTITALSASGFGMGLSSTLRLNKLDTEGDTIINNYYVDENNITLTICSTLILR
jgi:hypothetical protein